MLNQNLRRRNYGRFISWFFKTSQEVVSQFEKLLELAAGAGKREADLDWLKQEAKSSIYASRTRARESEVTYLNLTFSLTFFQITSKLHLKGTFFCKSHRQNSASSCQDNHIYYLCI